jgi:4-hydroxy-3-polyprenylbenzoate decarboxylase
MCCNYIVAITGASGAIYGLRLLRHLVVADARLHVIVSPNGAQVFTYETGIDIGDSAPAHQQRLTHVLQCPEESIRCHAWQDVAAPIASGSFQVAGMVVVPCSMSTLGLVAAGLGSDLITRAAAVTLKERRPLIMVPRETPFNRIHLQNMLTLHDAGAVVLPAMPGFYHQPRRIDDLIDFVVARILDQLGVAHTVGARWAGYIDPPIG